MQFNPDVGIRPGSVINPDTSAKVEATTPRDWFNDLNSGSELPIRPPVSPDFGTPKGINERVDIIYAHLTDI